MIPIWARVLAILEIVAGIIGCITGVASLTWNLFALLSRPLFLLLGLWMLLVNVLCLFAGIALWRGQASGRLTSIIIQIVQLPKIISPFLFFSFSFGADLYVSWMMNNSISKVGFDIKFLSDNQVSFYLPDAPIGFGVSVSALFFLIKLIGYKEKSPVMNESFMIQSSVPTEPPEANSE